MKASAARHLPKIELHAHLSGSISRQCLHDIWAERKQNHPAFELKDPLLEMPSDKFDYDLETFFPLFSKYIYNLCSTKASLIQSTNSVLADFEADGVVYLELRTTPRAIPSENISKTDYVSTILSCINNFNSSSMVTKLILSIDRRNTLAEALEVVDLALAHRPHGVVGIDLCGDPAKGDVSIFRPAFQKAKEMNLNITIHFAEAPASATEKELKILLEYEPQRIGHVIHVPEEIKKVIVERKLGLELCLSCNVHAKMITGSYGDHHFGEWRETGCPIVLCTDDVGVFGSSLSNEYVLISEHFALSKEEMWELARSGIECIFGGEDEKVRLRGVMDMWRLRGDHSV